MDEVEDRGTVVAQGGGKVSWLTDSLPMGYKGDSVAVALAEAGKQQKGPAELFC